MYSGTEKKRHSLLIRLVKIRIIARITILKGNTHISEHSVLIQGLNILKKLTDMTSGHSDKNQAPFTGILHPDVQNSILGINLGIHYREISKRNGLLKNNEGILRQKCK